MGLELLHDLKRSVRLGGWAIRLGPLRFHVGGGSYLVGRLSLTRWVHLLMAIHQLGLPPEALTEAPQLCPPPLAHFLVDTLVKPRHMRRISNEQMVELLQKVGATNDLPYLLTDLARRKAPGVIEGARLKNYDLFDEVDLFCCHRPMYKHEAAANLPAQVYHRTWESIEKQLGDRDSDAPPMIGPEFDHPPTLEEITAAMGQVGYHG